MKEEDEESGTWVEKWLGRRGKTCCLIKAGGGQGMGWRASDE